MLTVQQAHVEPAGGTQWRIRWRLTNAGVEPLAVVSAWLPNGRFRSQEWTLEPPLAPPPGASVELDSLVAWSEPPGTVVENGFLILRLADGSGMFARLTVTAGPSGEPHAVCETVTAG